jgi:hypothetical protein
MSEDNEKQNEPEEQKETSAGELSAKTIRS